MEDPASVEFVDIERAVKKIRPMRGRSRIVGHVKGKKNLGEATGRETFPISR